MLAWEGERVRLLKNKKKHEHNSESLLPAKEVKQREEFRVKPRTFQNSFLQDFGEKTEPFLVRDLCLTKTNEPSEQAAKDRATAGQIPQRYCTSFGPDESHCTLRYLRLYPIFTECPLLFALSTKSHKTAKHKESTVCFGCS